MLRIIVCLSALIACSYAIVCTEQICKETTCTVLTAENCQGSIKVNGGMCGCCDACITELAEGDSCSTLLLMGVPAKVQCADGLYCNGTTNVCTKNPGPCDAKQTEVDALRASSAQPLYGLEDPNCDSNGDYLGMQTRGSQAYCVTKDGTPIDSYMVNRWETGDDMNCQCARDMYAYMQTGLIGKLFNCAPNGNYKKTGGGD